MITEKDLQEAIAECEGQRNPNANTCIKLAAFYTIKEHMYGEGSKTPSESFYMPSDGIYSESAESHSQSLVETHSDTEFGKAVDGMEQKEFFGIMDELMSTLQIVQPRLYAGVIRKIKSLSS